METSSYKINIFREIVFLAVLTGLIFLFSGRYDLLERVVDFTRAHEHWELDEFITTAVFLSFVLTFFAMRRWLESRRFLIRLEEKNQSLEQAMDEIKRLKGILPICSSCKKIRNDAGYWQQVDAYIEKHSEAQFSHSMCPDCLESYYGDQSWYKKLKEEG